MNHEGAKGTKKYEDSNEQHIGSLIQREHGEALAWCFLPSDGRLRMLSPDGTRRRVQTGTIIAANDPLEMRHFRIHSAERAIDALQFGRGLFLCRVRLCGAILRERQVVRRDTPYERAHILVYGNEMIVLGAKDVGQVPKVLYFPPRAFVSRRASSAPPVEASKPIQSCRDTAVRSPILHSARYTMPSRAASRRPGSERCARPASDV
jgi:hypothetical protein